MSSKSWVTWFLEESLTAKDYGLCAGVSMIYFGSLCAWGYFSDTEECEVYEDNGREVKPGSGKDGIGAINNKDRKKKKILKRRRMAWFISLGNSFICSIIGVTYLFLKYPTDSNTGLPSWPMPYNYDVSDPSRELVKSSIFYGRENFGTLACIFFLSANVMDIICGLLFYKRHLSFLTTYFHHTLFSWLMVFAITTNGVFTTSPTPFVPAFVIALIEEIPTFIMALGSIFPEYRSDLGFGITFFITRVVCHIFYLWYVISWGCYTPIITMYVLTTVLHVNWFKDWISGQGAKYLPEFLRKLVERKRKVIKD